MVRTKDEAAMISTRTSVTVLKKSLKFCSINFVLIENGINEDVSPDFKCSIFIRTLKNLTSRQLVCVIR